MARICGYKDPLEPGMFCTLPEGHDTSVEPCAMETPSLPVMNGTITFLTSNCDDGARSHLQLPGMPRSYTDLVDHMRMEIDSLRERVKRLEDTGFRGSDPIGAPRAW